MQQPSFNPQGQQSPYNAPPPKKSGPSFLACCLGCLGLGVVVAIILGVVTYMKMNAAAGPPITAANYRAVIPADIPIYPGMQFDEKMTSAMRLAGGALGVVPGAKGAKMRMMAFTSAKGIDTIGPWYKEKLVPLGYIYMGDQTRAPMPIPGAPTSHTFMFHRGSTFVMLAQGSGGQAQFITMGIGTNMPQPRTPRGPR
ncbi:MAG TPA: hypothetical protein VGM37_03785 [Armatimonadota bacterium]|jgi:hypothetical protein